MGDEEVLVVVARPLGQPHGGAGDVAGAANHAGAAEAGQEDGEAGH